MFKDANAPDPALVHWITQLQNLLSQSYTEQAAYDFKQGFLKLDGSNQFDEDSFEKILKTCAAIANLRKSGRGYVIVGVAENKATADRVNELFGVNPRPYDHFHITGIEHEASALGKTLDQMFQWIIERVRHSGLSDDLREHLSRNIKPVRYYDKTVYVFEIEPQRDPSSYKGLYYTRYGAQLAEVKANDLPDFFRRYFGA